MKKILSALLILTLLLPCIVACDDIPKQEQFEDFPSVNHDISNYEGVIALFKDIVNLYPSYTEEKMLSNQCDGMDAIRDEETKSLYKKLFISGYRFYLKDYAYKYHADGRNYFGYAITDLNQNGSEELILLTDMYDIVAVFSMAENQPKLLLDNYEKKYDCRIDEIFILNIMTGVIFIPKYIH